MRTTIGIIVLATGPETLICGSERKVIWAVSCPAHCEPAQRLVN